jgi:alanine racemase
MLQSPSPRVKTGSPLNNTASTSPSPRETALAEGLRVWAEIDLDRLTANVHALKTQAGDAELLVVVKANAYGHGAVTVGLAAIQAGAWGLGVAGLEEGDELRRAGVVAPILVLSSTRPAQAQALVQRDLRVTVADLMMGRALSAAAQSLGRTARVHVKVETGMNRFGVKGDDAVALAEALRDLPGIEVEGVSSHLANADEENKAFTFQQYKAFRESLARLGWIRMPHISNTAALLDLPEMSMGLVRGGLGVYGYYPSRHVRRLVKLEPVLSLRSRVARVATLEAGEGVSYGMTWRASKQSRVALVLAGYGDGLRWSMSNKGVALVRGKRVPYAGRVMMDMLVLDVTDVPGVEVDDEVTLLGTQGSETVDADEMASLAGTINHEILTGLMERVPRLYVRDGQIVARQDLTGLRRTLLS